MTSLEINTSFADTSDNNIFDLMEPNEVSLVFSISTLAVTRFPIKTMMDRSKGLLVHTGCGWIQKTTHKEEFKIALEAILKKGILGTCVIADETRYSFTPRGNVICSMIRDRASKSIANKQSKVKAILT